MTDALEEWLALREPADTAARSVSLTRSVVGAISGTAPVRVLDLATGTGSNLRYLADRLPANQQWLVVDRSATLLGALRSRMQSWSADRGYEVRSDEDGCAIRGERLDCRVQSRCLDLGALDDVGIFEGRHLVTASALLDLVSEPWLCLLAARCHAVGAAALFAITYDGRCSCSPSEPEDGLVQDLFNQHQRTDKGLGGSAAGPDAAGVAARSFAALGYRVRSEQSDWVLGAGAGDLQRQLIEGWADAAVAIDPAAAEPIGRWKARRLGHVDVDRSRISVGHLDVGAWLPKLGEA